MVVDQEASDLIVLVAKGDAVAFERLYGLVKPMLRGLCTRMLWDRKEVDDALQEIFIKIWKSATDFSPEDHTTLGWLRTIAQRHAIDLIRLRKRRPFGAIAPGELYFDLLVDPAPDPEQALLLSRDLTRADQCLRHLSAEKAEAVRGAYLEGATYAELAERQRVPLNTMRTRLRRSLIEMRASFVRDDPLDHVRSIPAPVFAD